MSVFILSQIGRQELLDTGRQVKKELLEIADNLDKHHKNINISRVTGGGAGVVGSGMAIAGIIGLPFTLGLSGTLILGGAALGAAGGITSVGAELTGYFIKKSKQGKVENAWKTFNVQFLAHFSNLPEGDFSNILIVLEGSPKFNALVEYVKTNGLAGETVIMVNKGKPYVIDVARVLEAIALVERSGRSAAVSSEEFASVAGRTSENVSEAGSSVQFASVAGRTSENVSEAGSSVQFASAARSSVKFASVAGNSVTFASAAGNSVQLASVAGNSVKFASAAGNSVKFASAAGRASDVVSVAGNSVKFASLSGAGRAASDVVSVAGRTTVAASRASTAARVAGALTKPMALLNILAMGVNIYDIIDCSIQLARDEGSPASVGIRTLVDQIVDFLYRLENL